MDTKITEQNETTPSKEQIVVFFQDQIEIKKLQLELQKLNTDLAVARAEELRALSFIAQMTNPKQSNDENDQKTPYTITQEDLDFNPDLVKQGFKVGDEIMIPNEPKEETKSKRSLRK